MADSQKACQVSARTRPTTASAAKKTVGVSSADLTAKAKEFLQSSLLLTEEPETVRTFLQRGRLLLEVGNEYIRKEKGSRPVHRWILYVRGHEGRPLTLVGTTSLQVRSVEFLQPQFSPRSVALHQEPFRLARKGSSAFEITVKIRLRSRVCRTPFQVLRPQPNRRRNAAQTWH